MANVNKAIKYAILKGVDFDLQKAKECYDFIKEEPVAKDEAKRRDGVYLIDAKGNAVAFAGDDTCMANDTAYIGIVQDSHSVAIALQDVSEDEITLTSKTSDKDHGGYKDNYMDAVQDWDGAENTERLKRIGLNPAIQLKDGEYIPTLAELYLICLNRKTINAAMRFAGGQELAGWYWSSTEYSATSAWFLYLNIGSAGNYAKATNAGRVRPVSAFLRR